MQLSFLCQIDRAEFGQLCLTEPHLILQIGIYAAVSAVDDRKSCPEPGGIDAFCLSLL